MDQEEQARWQPTRKQVLWASIAVALLTVAILIGYRYGITLWDWLQLLVVPAVIAAGGLWFNRQQREREMHIAEQHSQDEALQAYLEGMSELLTDKDRPLHRAQPGDSLSAVARARTMTVLPKLNDDRKRSVIQFLYESGLISKERLVLDLRDVSLISADLSVIDLRKAALSGAILIGTNLREARLEQVDLSNAWLVEADLSGANLERVNLRAATLPAAVLSNAWLVQADLRHAQLGKSVLTQHKGTPRSTNLGGANLSEANLSEANLSEANLFGANLFGANLFGANLFGANLSEADLTDAVVAQEQLDQAAFLKGTTMPNGQKYEEWLKSRGEDGG